MEGTAKTLFICGKELSLGDFVEVEYTSGTRMKGGRIKGKITELWSPDLDKHYQARVESGWCFHDGDLILQHTPKL